MPVRHGRQSNTNLPPFEETFLKRRNIRLILFPCFLLALLFFFLLPPSPVLRSHAQARERRPLFSFRKGIQKASLRNASLCFGWLQKCNKERQRKVRLDAPGPSYRTHVLSTFFNISVSKQVCTTYSV